MFEIKKLNCIIIFFTMVMGAKAQQDPQFSQNMFNILAINPALAGIHPDIRVSAINRQQWVGIENAPTTTVFNIDTPIKIVDKKHGIGLTVISDKLGFEKNNNVRFSYSFHKKMKKGVINYGINFGFQNNALKADWIIPDGDGFTSPGSDPLLGVTQIDESHLVFDLGLGVFYQNEDFYLATSVTHLNQAEILYGENTKTFLKRHYYFTGGYTNKLTSNVEITPSLFYKTDGEISQMDINMTLLYNKKFWGGVSYRINDAIVALMGIKMKYGIQVGYAYDLSTSRISRSSHEFLVTYDFSAKLDVEKQRYKSVRFL